MQFYKYVVEAAGSDFSMIEEYMDHILQQVDKVHRDAGLRFSGVLLSCCFAFASYCPFLLRFPVFQYVLEFFMYINPDGPEFVWLVILHH